MVDESTGRAMFRSIQIQLACQPCIENGKVAECTHMLHLVPRWQSSERHIRLKTIMQDRPDLIESELSGLAFDSLQNCFREKDVSIMFDQTPLPPVFGEPIFIVVDPAAGGPQSDYAFISFTRNKGLVQVSPMPPSLSSVDVGATGILDEILDAVYFIALPFGDHFVCQYSEEPRRFVAT